MQRLSGLLPSVLFVILAPLDCYSQPPAQPPPGDVFESGGGKTPGDVYQSGGCPGVDNDMRHYIKNGTVDRCAWAEAHYICDPLTKQYGMPVHILIMVNGRQYRDQYERCGGDPCDPHKVVCWGWKNRPNPSGRDDGGTPNPTSGDVFESNGLKNCRQPNPDEVVCNLRFPIYPAVCFADTVLICDNPEIHYLKGGITESHRADPVQTGSIYGPGGNGVKLPAMCGQGKYGVNKILIHLPAGHQVGQTYEGPAPKIKGMTTNNFSKIGGKIDNSYTFKVTALWDLNHNRVEGVSEQNPINITISKCK